MFAVFISTEEDLLNLNKSFDIVDEFPFLDWKRKHWLWLPETLAQAIYWWITWDT